MFRTLCVKSLQGHAPKQPFWTAACLFGRPRRVRTLRGFLCAGSADDPWPGGAALQAAQREAGERWWQTSESCSAHLGSTPCLLFSVTADILMVPVGANTMRPGGAFSVSDECRTQPLKHPPNHIFPRNQREWAELDSNQRSQRQRIYSPPRLATSVSALLIGDGSYTRVPRSMQVLNRRFSTKLCAWAWLRRGRCSAEGGVARGGGP